LLELFQGLEEALWVLLAFLDILLKVSKALCLAWAWLTGLKGGGVNLDGSW
jgi:hypothetical protein